MDEKERQYLLSVLKDGLDNYSDKFIEALKPAINKRVQKGIELGRDFTIIRFRNGVPHVCIRGIVDSTCYSLGFHYGILVKQVLTRACNEIGVPILELY